MCDRLRIFQELINSEAIKNRSWKFPLFKGGKLAVSCSFRSISILCKNEQK